MKTPIQLWEQLKQLVLDAERDVIKSNRGMKAGGVRLRSRMQEVRDLSLDLRKSVLEHRTSRIRAAEPLVLLEGGGSAEGAALVHDHDAAEKLEPAAMSARKPAVDDAGGVDSRTIPYWYSSFNY